MRMRATRGQLVNSLKRMQVNLVNTVNHVKQGTGTISVASDHLRESSY